MTTNIVFITINYTINYILILLFLTQVLTKYVKPKFTKTFSFFFLIIFLNLGGIPMFLGFFAKLPLILIILQFGGWASILGFMFLNFVFLYFYISFLKTLIFKKNKNILPNNNNSCWLWVFCTINIIYVFCADKIQLILFTSFFC